MKKLIPIITGLLLIAPQCFSQNFDWQWARYAQQQTQDPFESSQGWSTACNATVGVYITGWFTDTTILNSDTLFYNPGLFNFGQSFYLARYDVSGNIRWARTPHGGRSQPTSYGYGVASDTRANACITGTFSDSLIMGNVVLPPANSQGVFVAKYDSSGNALWAIAPRGSGYGVGSGITTDANNNIYVTGYFSSGTFTFDTTVLVNAGTYNAFLLKYDSAGNPLWAFSTHGNLYDFGEAVATDDNGNVYFTGYFTSDTFKIGNTIIYRPVTDTFEEQIFTAKLNSAGNLIWVKTAHNGLGAFRNNSVAADTRGNVYTTGFAGYDTLYFDSGAFINASSFFLAKYDSSGNLQWVKRNNQDYGAEVRGYCVTTDINDNVYVSGGVASTGGKSEIFKIDSTVLLLDMKLDPMFIFELDPNGNVLHAQVFMSGGDDQNWVCVDRLGNGYLGGDITLGGNIAFGPDTVIQSGNENMFIAKFNPDSLACSLGPPTINAETNTICANDSALVCAPNNFASYRWNTGQTTPCFYTSLAGNYYVTVTDSHGCEATSNTVAITVNMPPTISITVNGDTLTANNGVTFQWYLNGNLLPGDNGNQIIGTKGGSYAVQITDSNGCTSTSNPVVIGGINSLAGYNISIYPNPSVGNWQLAIGNNLIGAAFEVWDNDGRIIYQSKITSVVTEINLPALASGVYFLRINTGEGLIVRKLLKM
jgi:hypothetical protein